MEAIGMFYGPSRESGPMQTKSLGSGPLYEGNVWNDGREPNAHSRATLSGDPPYSNDAVSNGSMREGAEERP